MGNYYRILYILLIVSCLPAYAHAQTGHVNGRILLPDGQSASRAHVTILKTKRSATTDADGQFFIRDVPTGTYKLAVSYVGHKAQEEAITIQAGQATDVTMTLKSSLVDLNEVQVVGKSESAKLAVQPITVASLDIKNVFERKTSISDALDQVSGIRVRTTGAAGAPADISVNGLRGNSVRLYIDGIPVEFIAAGLNIGQIPLNSIKRVDIYKGVMPVDIGTDALGGGINVVTNQPQYNYARASYRIGSFNTHQAGLVLGAVNKSRTAYVNLTSSYDYSDNNFKMRALDIESGQTVTVRRFNDQYKSLYTRLTAGLMNLPWADDLQLGVTYVNLGRQYQNGLAINNVPFGEARYDARNYTLSLKYDKNIKDRLMLSSLVNYGVLDYVFTDTTRNIYSWTGKVVQRARAGGESNNHMGALFPHITTNGVANRTTVAYSLGNFGRLTLSNFYAWKQQTGYNPLIREESGEIDYLKRPQDLSKNITGLQYEVNSFRNRLTTIVAGKAYHFSLQGIERTTNQPISSMDTKWGGNVSLKYAFTDRFFLRSSFENAIRIPDFTEVFGDNATIVSNLTLQPERSNNINLGGVITHSFGQKLLNVEVNGFYRAQKNRIFLNANNGIFARYENREEVTVKGVEMALKATPAPNWLASVNLTYQDIRLMKVAERTQKFQEGQRLPNEPVFFYNAELRYTFQNLPNENSLNVFVFYNHINEFAHILTGAQYNPDNYVPAQNLIDAGASYKFLNKRMTASLTVQNILNSELFDYYRVPRPGRNANFQLIYELNRF